MNAIDILLIVILAFAVILAPSARPANIFPANAIPFSNEKPAPLGRGLFVCRNRGGVRRTGAAFPRIIC